MLRVTEQTVSSATLILDTTTHIRRTYSLLHLATMTGDLVGVTTLLASNSTNIKTKDSFGRPALYYAMRNQHLDIALLLARKRWRIFDEVVQKHMADMSNGSLATSLSAAIVRNDKNEVGFLIDIGADMEARGYGNWPSYQGTMLHEAAYWSKHWGSNDILKLMLKNGADKSAKDIYGNLPDADTWGGGMHAGLLE